MRSVSDNKLRPLIGAVFPAPTLVVSKKLQVY